MDLLDLPPEVFEHIMTELVESTPVAETWKLRAVCLRIPDAHDVHAELPKKVEMMAGYPYKELSANTVAQKWKVLVRLCEGLATTIQRLSFFGVRNGLQQIIWLDDNSYLCNSRELDIIERTFGVEDEAVASLAICDVALVKKTLLNIPVNTSFGLYSDPLKAAVVLGNLKMIDAIMDVLTSDESKSQAERKALVLSDSSSVFRVKTALLAAISQGRLTFFRRLLDFLLEHVMRPSNDMYTELLSFAIKYRDDPAYLTAIFDIVAKDQNLRKHRVSSRLFDLACRRKAKKCIVSLIKDGGMKADYYRLILSKQATQSENSPLFMVVRSRSVTNITAVLAAGADIDLMVHHQQKKKTYTALEYAADNIKEPVHRNAHLLDCLLEHGATLPRLSVWPSRRIMYDKFRDVKYSREGVWAPEYKEFRKK
ncbi:hypothetical protein DE146DRAFT_634350 [Phaeosphaeria sp. MPI-PUGE-AT-0046c]|nr:hypothetical protein DE146DRAFT_634350 [Phaeosphaeria sp. MPI-PUGE-AT-0046c]